MTVFTRCLHDLDTGTCAMCAGTASSVDRGYFQESQITITVPTREDGRYKFRLTEVHQGVDPLVPMTTDKNQRDGSPHVWWARTRPTTEFLDCTDRPDWLTPGYWPNVDRNATNPDGTPTGNEYLGYHTTDTGVETDPDPEADWGTPLPAPARRSPKYRGLVLKADGDIDELKAGLREWRTV